MIINASGNIVEQDGKFLLVQEGRKEFPGKWNLPCGELDSGESIVACAAREGKEETGYELEVVAWVGQYQQLQWSVFGGHDLVVNVFNSKIVGGEKTVPSDLLDVAWFSFEEICEMAIKKELLHLYVLHTIATHRERMAKIISSEKREKNIPIESGHFRIYPSNSGHS